jgi:CSLREA domain-containing protein
MEVSMQLCARSPQHRPIVLFLESLEDRITPTTGLGHLVVFGDSLADEGNVSLATGGALPGPAYSQGRYSGGPIWVNTLAEYLGVPTPTASGLPGHLTGGLDFAFGGATVALPDSSNPYGTPSVSDQVALYLSGHHPASNDLFALWAGANDFFFSGGAESPFTSANALAADVQALVNAGGRQFVVNNLPPLGETPFFQDALKAALASGDPTAIATAQATIAGANTWAGYFNFFLGQDLNAINAEPGVNVVQVDIPGVLTTLAQPNNPLGLTNFDSAVGPYNPTTGLLTSVTASNPGQYLFWDSVHPGPAASQYIGLVAAADELSALHVTTLTVTTTADTVDPTDGKISLREAVNLANAMPGGTLTINFDLGPGFHDIQLTKELDIAHNTKIVGPGADRLGISGQDASRIFNIDAGADVAISGLTLHDGRAIQGGAIDNAGELHLTGMVFFDNEAVGAHAAGGAIYNTGVLDVLLSAFVDNEALGTSTADGGAIASTGTGASLNVELSAFIGDEAVGHLARGGAIFVDAHTTATVNDSLFVGNLAWGTGPGGKGYGGALYVGTSATFTRHGLLFFGNFATTDGWNLEQV